MAPLRKVRSLLSGYIWCQLRLLPALILMGMVPCFVSPPKRGWDLRRSKMTRAQARSSQWPLLLLDWLLWDRLWR